MAPRLEMSALRRRRLGQLAAHISDRLPVDLAIHHAVAWHGAHVMQMAISAGAIRDLLAPSAASFWIIDTALAVGVDRLAKRLTSNGHERVFSYWTGP